MITLFTNGFSPFARKVAMALEYKGLDFESIEGLSRHNRERLLKVNPRAEVPALLDDDLSVVNSSEILAFLEHKYPERPIYPKGLKASVAARALERMADTAIDAIILNCSIWTWAIREDKEPPGLKEYGQRDLDAIFARIEAMLGDFDTPLPFGHLTIAEFALWPHLTALRAMGLGLDATKYPRLHAWFIAMREHKTCLDDAQRTTNFMKTLKTNDEIERTKLFWRGDRVEWLLARGFHEWFYGEIKAGRVLWPEY